MRKLAAGMKPPYKLPRYTSGKVVVTTVKRRRDAFIYFAHCGFCFGSGSSVLPQTPPTNMNTGMIRC